MTNKKLIKINPTWEAKWSQKSQNLNYGRHCSSTKKRSQNNVQCSDCADVKPEVTAFLSQDIVAPMILCPLPCPCVNPRAWDSKGACTSVTPGAMEGCSDDATAS